MDSERNCDIQFARLNVEGGVRGWDSIVDSQGFGSMSRQEAIDLLRDHLKAEKERECQGARGPLNASRYRVVTIRKTADGGLTYENILSGADLLSKKASSHKIPSYSI